MDSQFVRLVLKVIPKDRTQGIKPEYALALIATKSEESRGAGCFNTLWFGFVWADWHDA